MSLLNLLASLAPVAWGVWWVAFPRSVIRFYRWFNRYAKGRDFGYKPDTIRIFGAAWLGFLAVVALLSWWRGLG